MADNSPTAGKCPVMHGGNTTSGDSNMKWWPSAFNLAILNQHDSKTKPLGAAVNYREELKNWMLMLLKKT